jgi:HK97 family phage portal protein
MRFGLGIIDRLFGRKASATTGSIVMSLGGQREVQPMDNLEAQSYAYESSATVYACVNIVARACAGISWDLYDQSKTTEYDEHPLLSLLARPNPMQAGGSFTFAQVAYREITGNAYTESVGPDSPLAPPLELYSIRPDRVQVIAGDQKSLVSGYAYTIAGKTTRFDVLHMHHWKLFSPRDDFYGMSRIRAGSQVIATDKAATTWNRSVLANSGVPPGAIKIKADYTAEQLNRMKELFEDRYLGPDNARRPMILGGDWEWLDFTRTALEMDWLQGRKLTKREICQIFCVPPELIGDSESKTYCLPGDTRVSTPRGPVRIDEINVGDSVWSLTEDQSRIMAGVVTKSGCTGRKKLLRLSGQGRSIRATGNHPILIRDRSKDGGTKTSPVKEFLCYRAAEELRVGDIVVVAKSYPEVGSGQEFSDNSAEWFGAFLGDGFAKIYGSSNAVVSMAGNPGPVRDFYRDLVPEVFQAEAGRELTIQEYDREFRFSSKKSVEFLGRLGLLGNAHTKRVPQWVHSQCRSFRLSFLRGLCDTDGSVDKRGVISYASVNNDLALDVRDLCLGLGIQTGKVSRSTRTCRLPNGDMSTHEISVVTLTQPNKNAEIGSRDPQDDHRLRNRNQLGRDANSCGSGLTDPLSPPDGCGFMRITKIEELDAEDVYDIEVEGTHCFFADHVCVHNSNYQEARKSFYAETILPIMDDWAAELNAWLVPKFGSDLLLCYDRDSIDALQEDRAQVWMRIGSADWLSLNEQREATGFEPSTEVDADVPRAVLAQRAFAQPTSTPQDEPPADPSVQDAAPSEAASAPSGGAIKAFQPMTAEQKTAYWRSADAKRRVFESETAKRFAALFASERERVMRAFKAGRTPQEGGVKADLAVKAGKTRIASLLRTTYQRVGRFFFDEIRKQNSSKSIELKDLSTALGDMRAYFGALTSKRADLIAETSSDKIKRVIFDGIMNGDSTEVIAQKVESLYKDQFQSTRPDMIAETEVGTAMNAGAIHGADSIGKTYQKVWLSQRDDRVRDWHIVADGQAVASDGLFHVGPDLMEFPTDTSHGASIENVIRCRCYLLFQEAE